MKMVQTDCGKSEELCCELVNIVPISCGPPSLQSLLTVQKPSYHPLEILSKMLKQKLSKLRENKMVSTLNTRRIVYFVILFVGYRVGETRLSN